MQVAQNVQPFCDNDLHEIKDVRREKRIVGIAMRFNGNITKS